MNKFHGIPRLPDGSCGTADHFTRRTLLKTLGAAGLSAWLTPVARLLARAEGKAPRGHPAGSVIILWMAGAPSQLETFDPHPHSRIAYGSKEIKTAQPGVQIAEGLGRVAEMMVDLSLVRSV